VGVLEGPGDRQDDLDGRLLGEAVDLAQELLDVLPVDILHGEVVEAVGLLGAVALDDILVVELAGDLRLAEEPLEVPVVLGQGGGRVFRATIRPLRLSRAR